MKLLKTLAILLLILTALHVIARGQMTILKNKIIKPDSIRGSLALNPPIDGWFINGIFVPDKKPLNTIRIKDTVKVYFRPDMYWKFIDLSQNKRVATLVGNTLYVHNTDSITIKEQSNELRYLRRNGQVYRYQFGHIDRAFMFVNLKGGKAIW